MRSKLSIRYAVAFLSLLTALVVSIRFSERGILLPAPTTGALANAPDDESRYDLKSLNVLNQVILQLRQNYVEPERIDPSRMLVYALDRVQNEVPEVVALFNADLDAQPTSVEVRVGAQRREFDLTGIDSLWAMRFRLGDVMAFIEENVDAATDLAEVEYSAVNGVLGTLDPHSVLLSPKLFTDMEATNRGSFGGLGIVIGLRDAKLTVISPMANTPASRAGFRAGDNIVKINEESTVNMPLDEAVSKLRGAPGSSVTVEIMRGGWTEPHSFNMTREIITVQSVRSHALGNGIGYVEVQNFQDRTTEHMLEALAELDAEMGGLKGLVLDLRNNPGGLLQQAIRLTDTFLTVGTIVSTVGQGDRMRDENVATEAGTQPGYPIVVLVNPGSASASEIVAGALKSNNRAVIVGDRTFGKGTVQVLYPFGDGGPALKITVAQYLTPGNISIQGVGIQPDIQIVPVTITSERADLYVNENALREGDLEASLTSNRVDPNAERPSHVVKYYFAPEETDPTELRDPDEFVMDFEIEFARRLLIDAGATSERRAMLGANQDVIAQVSQEKMLEIQELLRGKNVDWSAGETVIQPVTMSVTTNRADNRAEAGEKLEITVTLRNDGDKPLHRVHAVSSSKYDLFNDLEFLFGVVNPGQERTWTVPVEVPVEDPSRYDAVELSAFADMIELGQTHSFPVEVTGKDRPHWGFNYTIDDSAHGNGDGLLQVGEKVLFMMTVTNNGAGEAVETTTYLRNESETAIFLIEGREELEQKLSPGSNHTSRFEFEVRERPESGNVKLVANVYDAVFREFLSDELEIPVEPDGAIDELVGFITVNADAPIHAGAADYTPIAAVAPGATTLEVGAQKGTWYLVSYNGGRGWINSQNGIFAARGEATTTNIPAVLHHQAPFVNARHELVRTSDGSVRITGQITDDRGVLDYFVFVQNFTDGDRPQSLKRGYEYVGAPTVAIDQTVPLAPGMNRITLVARDNEKIMSSQELFVFRDE